MHMAITRPIISYKNIFAKVLEPEVHYRKTHGLRTFGYALSARVFERYKKPGDDHIHVIEIFFQNFYSDKR